MRNGRCDTLGSDESDGTIEYLFAMVTNTHGWQTSTAFLEITDLDQSRPKLNGPADYIDDVTNDPQQILMEEVRLKAIERLVQVVCKLAERLFALWIRCSVA